MRLHEFLSVHREQILEAIQNELEPESAVHHPEDNIRGFFDEMLAAIRRDSGVRECFSPLPGRSEAAARLGADRQRAGVSLLKVPAVFAAISQGVAKTGELYELQIAADEYKSFNRCLDAGIATSIENFWEREQSQTNQLLTERYGYLAHELRNALGNVNMAYKLMRAGDLSMDGRTADVLGRNLTRMTALIAQCLGSVQIDVGSLPEAKPLQVAKVLRDIEAAAIPDRGIKIVLQLDELVCIRGGEMLLASAVSNLIHNAVKFSGTDATIHVHARSQGERALIEVEDECGGLGAFDLGQLAEAHPAERESALDGTGLGLSITKRAIEAMHGQLSVTDRPGLGCIFSASFPLLHPASVVR